MVWCRYPEAMTTAAGCATDLLTAVATIGKAVEVAFGAWERLGREQREAAYGELERARKKMAIIDAAYLNARMIDACVPPRRIAGVLAVDFHVSRDEGRRRAAAYRRLHEGEMGLASTSNPDFMPHVREKVAAGVIGADAVQKIDRAIQGMPNAIQEELTEKADPHVAELVEKVRVDDLDKLGSMLRALFGIDDPYTDEDRKQARYVQVSKQGHDGMSKLTGQLTPHLAALIKRLAADHGKPGDLLDDAANDNRCPGQRLHDALEAALAAGFGRGADPNGAAGWGPEPVDPEAGAASTETGVTGPGVGPVPLVDPNFGADGSTWRTDVMERDATAAGPIRRKRLAPARGTTSIVAVTTLAELMAMNGTVSTDTDVQMTVADAVERCEARNLFLQVLDFRGRTLYFGRSRRLGSTDQYLALLGEEGMTSAPFSSAPAAWCHMHHVQSWANGGESDLPNFTFVDPTTHANIDDDRMDPNKWWSRSGIGPDEPRVVWTPPRFVDPDREPAENEHPSGWANPGRSVRRNARNSYPARTNDRGRRRTSGRTAKHDPWAEHGEPGSTETGLPDAG